MPNNVDGRRSPPARALLVALAVAIPLVSSAHARAERQNAAPSPTPTATPLPSPTPVPLHLSYFLYAARVSPTNDKGDLEGLAAVPPGLTVWLMMYYIVKTVPGPLLRIATYSLSFKGKTIFHQAFRDRMSPSQVGRFIRYVPYTLPSGLASGRYLFQATLWIGGKAETKTWSFAIASQVRIATSSFSSSGLAHTSYLLYAARVSPTNNKGDLEGLAAVPPGLTVWLMMYYVVKTLPGPLLRIATYSISFKGKTIFHRTFWDRIAPSGVGRFIRYVPYTLPSGLASGRYLFRGTLRIGGKSETKTWSFAVTRSPGAQRVNLRLSAGRARTVQRLP